MEILKVATNSKPASVAGALIAVLEQNEQAALQAIGAGAVNQAVKAIAAARNFITSDDVDLVTIPAFVDVEIEGEDRTAIKLIVETQKVEDSVETEEEKDSVETEKESAESEELGDSIEAEDLEDSIESRQLIDS